MSAAPYVADIDVADAVLRLAVGLQALDEVAVLVGTDADAQFVVDVYPSPASHSVQFFEIEQVGAAEAGLLEVVVAHGLERRAQAEVHCRVAEEMEAILARQRGHPDAVATEQVVRCQEITPTEHLGQLFRRFTLHALVAKHAHEVRRHQAANHVAVGAQGIILDGVAAVAPIVGVGVLREADHFHLRAVAQALEGLTPVKVIVIPKRLVNIVAK